MLISLLLLSCAPDYTASDAKLVGVGYDPEEIGPSPQPYGGVVEYSWVNFAGAGLSLAMMQLASYSEIGPNFAGFAPPYAAVYGFSYLFSDRLTTADSLGGVTAVPPEIDDTCYTTFEASGPIGSFKTVDVGSAMRFVDADGNASFTMNRLPSEYPGNRQDSFVYYSSFDYWNPEPVYALVAGDTNKPEKMTETLVHANNFPFGTELTFRFPGGFAPDRAPLASLPLPSSAAAGGETKIRLPDSPGAVQLEWNGSRYDEWGREVDAGVQATCLTFASPEEGGRPQNPDECAAIPYPTSAATVGQIYTGPWDTDDGKVIFRWHPGSNPDQAVTLSVRFLGPIDRNDPSFAEEFVSVSPPKKAKSAWALAKKDKSLPSDFDMPDGRRSPTACEGASEWDLDDDFLDGSGNLIPSLRGDPNHNTAEVSCRLTDDGEFVLTDSIVQDALEYARAHRAEGVVFYFGRSVEVDAGVPPAMDAYGNRLDISPIKVASRAIDIGRFWLEAE